MTNEPFPPHAGTDPEQGSAPVVPVTPEMMDHAAHEAAVRADSVAHAAPEPIAAADEAPPATDVAAPDPEPVPAVPGPETSASEAAANQNVAAVESVGAGALRAADLAFTHGRESAGRAVERTARTADTVELFSAKVLEIAAANVSAAGDLVSALMGAKSVPEAAAINADHMRRSLDALTTQGRELMTLAQRAVFDAMRPPGAGSHKP